MPIRVCEIMVELNFLLCSFFRFLFRACLPASLVLAMRKTISKADKAPAKKKGLKQPEEVEELNPEQIAFHEIFGTKTDAGMPEVASKVLEEFVQQFPDATASGKGTARRGEVKLTKYVAAQGTRKSNAAVNRAPLWDKGLFAGKMATLRPNWSPERIQREWDLIESSASCANRGNNGPPEAPLQLRIPAWMIGESDWAEEKTENFEEKRLETSTKKAAWSHEEMATTLQDCHKGFQNLETASTIDARLPVSTGSVASSFEAPTFKRSLALTVGENPEAQKNASATKTVSPQKSDAATTPNAKKAKLVDVAVERSAIAQKQQFDWDKEVGKFTKVIVQTLVELDRACEKALEPSGMAWQELRKRFDAGLLFLGREIAKVSGSQLVDATKKFKFPADVTLTSIGTELDMKNQMDRHNENNKDHQFDDAQRFAEFNLRRLMNNIAHLPVEGIEKMPTLQLVNDGIKAVRECASGEEMEGFQAEFDNHMVQVNQLKDCSIVTSKSICNTSH